MAIDCDLYERSSEASEAGGSTQVRSSQGKMVPSPRTGDVTGPEAKHRCDVKWPETSGDTSTVHPYVFKSMVDLTAMSVVEVLESRGSLW